MHTKPEAILTNGGDRNAVYTEELRLRFKNKDINEEVIVLVKYLSSYFPNPCFTNTESIRSFSGEVTVVPVCLK